MDGLRKISMTGACLAYFFGQSAWSADETAAKTPKTVRVRIENALIGLGKVDGTNWDGPGKVDAQAVASLGALLAQAAGAAATAGASVVPAVAGLLAGPAIKPNAKPDTFGTAEATWPGGSAQVRLEKKQDTMNPVWGVALDNIPFSEGIKIRITLKDKDLMNDDDMGVVVLDFTDISNALKNGKVFPVHVGDQSHNQILFINISVEVTG